MTRSGLGRSIVARWQRCRSQAGITLVELLVATAVAGVIVAPVGSWMIMSISRQAETAGRFTDSAQARLATTYISRDVASAELVSDTPPYDACGTDSSPVVFSVLHYATEPLQIDYVQSDTAGEVSVWRRECKVADRDVITDTTEILRGVRTGSTAPPGAEPDALCTGPCRSITFTAILMSGADIKVTAARRATIDPSLIGAGGNFLPNPRIEESGRTGTRPNFQVTLDGSGSTDFDGTIVAWDWQATGPATLAATGETPTMTFAAAGTYELTLTVTDDDGGTKSTRVPLVVSNLAPVASPSVDRASGAVADDSPVAPGDVFTFTANANDPDEDGIASIEWDFGPAVEVVSGGGTGTVRVRFASTAELGDRNVRVRVTDALGAASAGLTVIELTQPGGTVPPYTGPIAISVGSGPPLGSPAQLDPIGTVGAGRPAVVVNFSSTTSGSWVLRRGGVAVGAPVSGATRQDSFTTGGGGEYVIELTPDGGGAPVTRSFRVNDAPVALFASSAQQPASTVAFDSTSTDDRLITSHLWNFGFFARWTSTEADPTWVFGNNPGTYSVVLAVTDDDGITTSVTRSVTIQGTPPTPVAPDLNGNTVTWPPVPGATTYDALFSFVGTSGGISCSDPAFRTVTASEAPTVQIPTSSCDTVTQVTVSYRVNAIVGGNPVASPDSAVVTRP